MKIAVQSKIAAAVGAVALTAVSGSAQDWPQWRGANRDAKATGFTAPATWPKELAQKWKITVGDGVATPSLVGDKLYVFGRQDENEVIRCLDAATGKELWSDKYSTLGASGPAAGFSGPRSSPAVADGKVVTLGVRGILSCLDASSGKVLWRKENAPGELPRFQVSSSPLIADGLCVAQISSGNGGVIAFDLATGAEKWKWSGGTPAYASPTLLTVGGTKYVVAETDNKVVALALADGKLAWETPFAVQGMRGYNASSPIVDGATVIYTGSGRGATAVKFEKKDDGLSGQELWKNQDNSVQFNTPVLKGGFLYGLNAANDLFCLNTQDGKTAWSAPLNKSTGGENAAPPAGGRGRGGSAGYGSLVDAGSVLLALTPASQLVVLQPGEKAATELARIKVADSPTHAYPVVSGKRIFIKDQTSVALYVVE